MPRRGNASIRMQQFGRVESDVSVPRIGSEQNQRLSGEKQRTADQCTHVPGGGDKRLGRRRIVRAVDDKAVYLLKASGPDDIAQIAGVPRRSIALAAWFILPDPYSPIMRVVIV